MDALQSVPVKPNLELARVNLRDTGLLGSRAVRRVCSTWVPTNPLPTIPHKTRSFSFQKDWY